MTSAHRTLLLSCLLLSAGPAPAADPPDNPLSLIVEAGESLDRGDPVRAAMLAERVGALIASDSGWDPDGSIGHRILPALHERIARMREATDALDRLGQPQDQEPGEASRPKSVAQLLALVKQTTEETARLRAGLERIADSVPQGPERGGLLQTESYRRAAGHGGLPDLADLEGSLQSLPPEAPDEDETVRVLRTRLDALKREVIALSVESETLKARLDSTQRSQDEDRARMIEFIGHDPPRLSGANGAGLDELSAALADRLRDRLQEVRALTGQSPLEKTRYVGELDRFRLANAMSVAEGSRSLSGRIDALAAAIETVPVIGGQSVDPNMGWFSCCLSVCRR